MVLYCPWVPISGESPYFGKAWSSFRNYFDIQLLQVFGSLSSAFGVVSNFSNGAGPNLKIC